MVSYSLDGNWKMKKATDSDWLDATVPGSVYSTLLSKGMIEDPFYRDNEETTQDVGNDDYEFEREFFVIPQFLSYDKVFLCCEGLDTLAEIQINGKTCVVTDNMHRIYVLEVKNLLLEGDNKIRVIFSSPVRYVEDKQRECPLWNAGGNFEGFSHIRKAHYMFSWDWGPKVPDMGIWRSISLKGYNHGKLEDVYITQEHREDSVELDISINLDKWIDEELDIEVNVICPDGSQLENTVASNTVENHLRVTIDNPKLWWTADLGD